MQYDYGQCPLRISRKTSALCTEKILHQAGTVGLVWLVRQQQGKFKYISGFVVGSPLGTPIGQWSPIAQSRVQLGLWAPIVRPAIPPTPFAIKRRACECANVYEPTPLKLILGPHYAGVQYFGGMVDSCFGIGRRGWE